MNHCCKNLQTEYNILFVHEYSEIKYTYLVNIITKNTLKIFTNISLSLFQLTLTCRIFFLIILLTKLTRQD